MRERKNEFGDSEEVCRATVLALLFHGQPIRSTGHDGLPTSGNAGHKLIEL